MLQIEIEIEGFKKWLQEEPIRGNDKIIGKTISTSPVGRYISYLLQNEKGCWIIGDQSAFPMYDRYMTYKRHYDKETNMYLEEDPIQPLPEWSVKLHTEIVAAYGHSSSKAEWFYSGEDILSLIEKIEQVEKQ